VKKKLHRTMRMLIYFVLLIPFTLSGFQASGEAQQNNSIVYIVPVESNIERGLQAFMERSFQEAQEAGADHIILEISTFGGAVDAAAGIGALLQQTKIPITAYVKTEAISAGAYIALNADQIVMSPTSTMGAATVVDQEGNAGEAKAMSYWIKAMGEAAEANGRDPKYAKAMVDINMEIEGVVKKGEVLTFGATDALEHGYAEKIVQSREEVLSFLGLDKATIVEVDTTFAEKIARFVTSPIVMPILFSLGSLGIMLELYSPGFGVAGAIGVSALGLFFFGHMIAGFAGWESVLLFILGLVLIVIEIFVPGLGIFGILGAVSVIGGLALASFDYMVAIQAIGYAAIITILGVILLAVLIKTKKIGTPKTLNKIILQEELSQEERRTRIEEKSKLINQVGIAATRLRPAGIIIIDQKRYDAISEGGMIEKDQPIKVVYADGTKIVVAPVKS